jgi:hypothetical protein
MHIELCPYRGMHDSFLTISFQSVRINNSCSKAKQPSSMTSNSEILEKVEREICTSHITVDSLLIPVRVGSLGVKV